jgi:hypothetical protein
VEKKPISVQAIINKMVSSLRLGSENQLCEILNITPSTMSKWKARDSIPEKHLKTVEGIVKAREVAAGLILEITISSAEVAEALGVRKEDWIYKYKKKNPYLYELIENGLKVEKASR